MNGGPSSNLMRPLFGAASGPAMCWLAVVDVADGLASLS